jgi:hypothetical protein
VVDLQARLRNWEAQEAVLLRLMAGANSIEDSNVVQRQLQDVQLAIEGSRGQLRALQDQTEISTISISMSEAGFMPRRRVGGARLSRPPRRAGRAVLVLGVLGYRRFRRVPTAS